MSEAALIFPAEKTRLSLAFPAFLLVSLFLHLLGFYLFQVVYRDPLNVPPPSAFLTLLRRDDPGNASILDWIHAQDPALAAQPPAVAPPGLLEVPYLPSYDDISVQPVLPEWPSQLPELPPGRTFRQLTESALLPPAASPASIPAPSTRLVASQSLRHRLPDLAPLPAAAAPSALEPTRFLVGVTAQGGVAFVFLQSGSGDPGADVSARQHLQALAFAPDPDRPLTWSPIAYYWGARPEP